MNKLLLYFFIVFYSFSLNAQNDTIIYSFFSAGHTYGNPNNHHYRLHYPFSDFIPNINNNPKIDLGVLTGDVVVSSTSAYWDSAQVDIDEFNIPIHIAAGNHDMGQEYINRFSDYFYSFNHENDLFIILTPGLDAWNISGQQLTFLENVLDNNHAQVNNIFIFMHELIWWSPTNQYQNIDINYVPHYPGSTNFDTIIKPLLLSYSNNITLFAGDLGCTNLVSPFMYDHFNNITLIGSGMGGEVSDNIIITDVYQDSVYHNLVAINGTDENALGAIYDYPVDISNTIQSSHSINIFPNPTTGLVSINLGKDERNIKIKLINCLGQSIFTKQLDSANILTFNIEAPTGVYFLRIENLNGKVKTFKILKN